MTGQILKKNFIKKMTKILKKLGEVLDPELNVSVVDLGLIYEAKEEKGQQR